MTHKRFAVLVGLSASIIALWIVLSPAAVQGECILGDCISKACKEYCCGTILLFNHRIVDPHSFWPEEEVRWTYVYKKCPGACEDTYPYSVCTEGCIEIQ